VACEEARELIAKLRDEGNSIKSVHMIRGADLGVWYALMRRAAEFIERGTPPSATVDKAIKGSRFNGFDWHAWGMQLRRYPNRPRRAKAIRLTSRLSRISSTRANKP
jgi:hypothetical protein